MRGRGGGVERVSYERISGDVEEVLQVTVMMIISSRLNHFSASCLVADKPRVQERTQDQRERDAGRA